MSNLQIFDVEGRGWRFGQDGDGTPWAVASDVAKSFDQRDADKVTRLLDADEKGTRIVGTPGGPQEMKKELRVRLAGQQQLVVIEGGA